MDEHRTLADDLRWLDTLAMPYPVTTDMTPEGAPSAFLHQLSGLHACAPRPVEGRKYWRFERKADCEAFRLHYAAHVVSVGA